MTDHGYVYATRITVLNLYKTLPISIIYSMCLQKILFLQTNGDGHAKVQYGELLYNIFAVEPEKLQCPRPRRIGGDWCWWLVDSWWTHELLMSSGGEHFPACAISEELVSSSTQPSTSPRVKWSNLLDARHPSILSS